MIFKIEIQEILQKQFIINAKTESEAFEILKQGYRNADEDYVLTSDDFVEVEFCRIIEE